MYTKDNPFIASKGVHVWNFSGFDNGTNDVRYSLDGTHLTEFHTSRKGAEAVMEFRRADPKDALGPKPAKITLEHREGEYVHFADENGWFEWVIESDGDKWYQDSQWNASYSRESAQKYAEGAGGYHVVNHGFLTGEVKPTRRLVWPKGTHIVPKDQTTIYDRTLSRDFYAGDGRVYYNLDDDFVHEGNSTNIELWTRLYVVGDLLPAGVPMPANGLVEWDTGNRFYRAKGATIQRNDAKIIWLETEG